MAPPPEIPEPSDEWRAAPDPPRPPVPVPATNSTAVVESRADREEMLEMLLNNERERREMAWEMSRELFRLREMVERQQRIMSDLIEKIGQHDPQLALTEGGAGDGASAPTVPAEALPSEFGPPPAPPGSPPGAATEEMTRLKQELEVARNTVDRLRRGKLDLERRTAEAEAVVEQLQERGILGRLLRRGE